MNEKKAITNKELKTRLDTVWTQYVRLVQIVGDIRDAVGAKPGTPVNKLPEMIRRKIKGKESMKKAITILLFAFLTATTYGQDYAQKVEDYFSKRSCLPGVTAAYAHAWDDYEGWSGWQDTLPVIYALDSEGIERMADWAGRVIAWRVEEFALGNVMWRVSNYNPVIHSTAEFDSMLNTTQPAAARKVVIVGHNLISRIKGRPNFATPESMPPDHHYTGKSQYFGFLSARIGSFSSLGLSWAGSDYNAVSMDMGAVQFELNVKSAYFQGGAFFVLDYECFVRPVGDVRYYAVR